MKNLVFAAALSLFAALVSSPSALAQTDLKTPVAPNNATEVDGYIVRHSVFNSTFLPPEVAKQYGIKRSAYESIINVSVDKQGEFGGMPVELSGTSTNLMQQQKVLDFQTIDEGNAIYYIAPIRIAGEETLHFKLNIGIGEQTLEVKFVQKIYAD